MKDAMTVQSEAAGQQGAMMQQQQINEKDAMTVQSEAAGQQGAMMQQQQSDEKDAMTVQSEAAGQQGAIMLQPWGGINSQAKYSRAQVPVSKEVPACSHMRLAEGPGDDEHHFAQEAQRLPSPGLQGASWERETKVDEEWEQVRQSEGSGNCPGWTSTSSVLSAIVATQAATEKPVWGPAALR